MANDELSSVNTGDGWGMDGWKDEWLVGQMESRWLNRWMDIIQRHVGLINRGIVFLKKLSEH